MNAKELREQFDDEVGLKLAEAGNKSDLTREYAKWLESRLIEREKEVAVSRITRALEASERDLSQNMSENTQPEPNSGKSQSARWTCRFHPTDWFHEVGCPHQEWTKEQLQSALETKKRFEEKHFGEILELNGLRGNNAIFTRQLADSQAEVERLKLDKTILANAYHTLSRKTPAEATIEECENLDKADTIILKTNQKEKVMNDPSLPKEVNGETTTEGLLRNELEKATSDIAATIKASDEQILDLIFTLRQSQRKADALDKLEEALTDIVAFRRDRIYISKRIENDVQFIGLDLPQRDDVVEAPTLLEAIERSAGR